MHPHIALCLRLHADGSKTREWRCKAPGVPVHGYGATGVAAYVDWACTVAVRRR